MPHGVAGNAETDLLNVVLNHFPARFVVLIFSIAVHLLYIRLRIRRKRSGYHLKVVWCDFQVCRKGRYDVLAVAGRFQIDVDRQHLQDLYKAVILGDDHSTDDILMGSHACMLSR